MDGDGLRDLVAGKTGFLYVYDELTGKPVWPIEERRIPRSRMKGVVSPIATSLREAEQSPGCAASGHKCLPLGQCGRATFAVVLSINEVAFGIEMVVQGGMDRGELL